MHFSSFSSILKFVNSQVSHLSTTAPFFNLHCFIFSMKFISIWNDADDALSIYEMIFIFFLLRLRIAKNCTGNLQAKIEFHPEKMTDLLRLAKKTTKEGKQQRRCKLNLKRESWSGDKQKAPFVKLFNKHNGSKGENFKEHKACQRELRWAFAFCSMFVHVVERVKCF